MRIDAITSCVNYTQFFEKCLPVWLDTLDSLTIVTTPDDSANNFKGSNLRIVTTDEFYHYGAYFNKGAALNTAYRASNPQDWCLHIDADIRAPANWRELAEPFMDDPNKFIGAPRVYERSSRLLGLNRHNFLPYGYFQLWHTSSVGGLCWPVFSNWHYHAGAYDSEFLEKWDPKDYVRLPITLYHQTMGSQNWFGIGKEKMMKHVGKVHVMNGKVRRVDGIGILQIPHSPANFIMRPGNTEWIKSILSVCRKYNQFYVRAVTTDEYFEHHQVLDPGTPPEEVERIILDKGGEAWIN